MIIYRILNKINGKVYIGKTSRSIAFRWKEHCEYAFKRNSKLSLYCDMREYGVDAFYVDTIMDDVNPWLADYFEIGYISEHRSTEDRRGYNGTPGNIRACHIPEPCPGPPIWRIKRDDIP